MKHYQKQYDDLVQKTKDGYYILVSFECKYGPLNCLANSQESLDRLFLNELESRWNDKCYFVREDIDKIKKPSCSKEQMGILSDGAVKLVAQKEWRDYSDQVQSATKK